MYGHVDRQIQRSTPRITTARPRYPALAPARIRVALIEDNRLVREGLTALLAGLPDLELVANTLSTDIAHICSMSPQVVLLDVGLMNGDGLRLTSQLRKLLPEAHLIVMDLLAGQQEIVQFVNVGVSGFIMRDASLDEFANTIRAVANGTNVLPSTMINTLFSHVARDTASRSRSVSTPTKHMTPREHEVIGLIAEGLANKEIAARLHIATHTVKSHVGNVMEKLALHSRLQIAAYAHACGQA